MSNEDDHAKTVKEIRPDPVLVSNGKRHQEDVESPNSPIVVQLDPKKKKSKPNKLVNGKQEKQLPDTKISILRRSSRRRGDGH